MQPESLTATDNHFKLHPTTEIKRELNPHGINLQTQLNDGICILL